MLVTARLKYIVENEWGCRRYLDVSLLEEKEDGCRAITPVAPPRHRQICEKSLTVPINLAAKSKRITTKRWTYADQRIK